MTAEECRSRGWDAVDIVLVTGDGYIDHPSFGVALIGRLLESKGYRVAVLAQPHHDSARDFFRFGKPRLFFGITAGNLDSIVANYTGNGKVRDFDAYSQAGNPWRSGEQSRANRLRPDRATILYANLARSAYNDVPVILGGVEASLRRFVHYDYKQAGLRGSVLTDAKADLLIYGMGERAVSAAAALLDQGRPLTDLEGSCERLTERQFADRRDALPPESLIQLPSWRDIQADKALFLQAELLIDKHARSNSASILVQQQQSGWVMQHPAPPILSGDELDRLYSLPFKRTPHPLAGDIPAYRMIRHSVTIVRGCSGNCAFCAITRHQGPMVSSRGSASVLREVRQITTMEDFAGTISDLGGPTANLYGSSCRIGGCKKHECLYPKVCEHLQVDEEKMIALLEKVSSLERVKHVFVSSGLRMELLLKTPKLLKKLIASHTPGSLKIAPEHSEDELLDLMHKESHAILRHFVKECRSIGKTQKKEVQLTPYVITGHPGSTEDSARQLVDKFKKLGLSVRRPQDFTATPGTLSTAMLVSGLNKDGKKIVIPTASQKMRQRALLEEAFFKRDITTKKKRPRKK
jgi:uncharacterized radical SAM protein YgiQ